MRDADDWEARVAALPPRRRRRVPRAPEHRPLVAVVNANQRTGRGSLLGPDTPRRTSWWELTLECGHQVERFVSYPPREPRMKGRERSWTEALPPPKRARCDECPKAPSAT